MTLSRDISTFTNYRCALITCFSMVVVFDAKLMDAIVLLLESYNYADHMAGAQILISLQFPCS